MLGRFMLELSPGTMSGRPSWLMSRNRGRFAFAPPSSIRIRNGISGGLAAEDRQQPAGRHRHTIHVAITANHRPQSSPHAEMPASGPRAYAGDGWPPNAVFGVGSCLFDMTNVRTVGRAPAGQGVCRDLRRGAFRRIKRTADVNLLNVFHGRRSGVLLRPPAGHAIPRAFPDVTRLGRRESGQNA